MSKKWTPEVDVILLSGIFEEYQVSFGKALCEKLAERIRAAGIEGFTECTPKSIENRLYTWKKKNVKPETGSTDTPPATPKKNTSTPKKAAETPKTKTPRAKKGVAKKQADVEEEDHDEDALRSPSVGRKRKGESEEGGEAKKVKVEPLTAAELDELMGRDEEGEKGDEAKTAFV